MLAPSQTSAAMVAPVPAAAKRESEPMPDFRYAKGHSAARRILLTGAQSVSAAEASIEEVRCRYQPGGRLRTGIRAADLALSLEPKTQQAEDHLPCPPCSNLRLPYRG